MGFDPHLCGYLHHVLPFDFKQIAQLKPLLAAAGTLVASGAVMVTETGADVASGGVLHRVSLDSEDWRCTCPWFAKNGTARGPCKNVLAAEMEREIGG